uniref:Transposase n=1 Tax=Heterorhabditis bacteriophora TaxID=37862 RepID=A0A1I7X308_HETBA
MCVSYLHSCKKERMSRRNKWKMRLFGTADYRKDRYLRKRLNQITISLSKTYCYRQAETSLAI